MSARLSLRPYQGEMSYSLAGLGDCNLILHTLLWSIDSGQNRVSTNQYHMTISQAQVSTHQGYVFCEVLRRQATSFQLIAGSIPILFNLGE